MTSTQPAASKKNSKAVILPATVRSPSAEGKAKQGKPLKESVPKTALGFQLIDPDLIDAKPVVNLRHYGSSEEAIQHKISTVKKVGQLQPARVYAIDGRFRVVFGSQRVQAAQLLPSITIVFDVRRGLIESRTSVTDSKVHGASGTASLLHVVSKRVEKLAPNRVAAAKQAPKRN